MHVHVGDTGDVGQRHVRNYVGPLPSINGPCVGIERREISRARRERKKVRGHEMGYEGQGEKKRATLRAEVVVELDYLGGSITAKGIRESKPFISVGPS